MYLNDSRLVEWEYAYRVGWLLDVDQIPNPARSPVTRRSPPRAALLFFEPIGLQACRSWPLMRCGRAVWIALPLHNPSESCDSATFAEDCRAHSRASRRTAKPVLPSRANCLDSGFRRDNDSPQPFVVRSLSSATPHVRLHLLALNQAAAVDLGSGFKLQALRPQH